MRPQQQRWACRLRGGSSGGSAADAYAVPSAATQPLVVTATAGGGMPMVITTPTGQQMQTMIPAGVVVGGQFQIMIPAPAPTAAAQPMP